ncbi:MAG: hypothetical protein L0Y44_01015 [Phycisphaerales bacterium]|nr:hypothetical protein [Phycisphaerales bacterium]MCI0629219.1 hypothetical protein [Phycisphaerales bacterium]
MSRPVLKAAPVVLIALSLYAGACGQAEKSPPAAAATASEGLTLKLLDAGAEPQRVLRFKPAAGDSYALTMIMRMSNTQKLGGLSPPVQRLPATNFSMEMTVTDVRSNGEIAYDFKLTEVQMPDDPTVAANVAASLRKMMNSLVGLEGNCEITDRGFTKTANCNVPANASPMVKQQIDAIKKSFRDMCGPMPEEAVGPGARWQAVSTIVQNGITIKQTAHTTLEGFDGENINLKVEFEQSADSQEVKAPGMPAGSSAHLNSLNSKGSGTMVLKVSQIVPISSNTQVATDTSLTMNMGGTPQDIQQHMETSMELKGEPAKRAPASTPKS